MLSMSSKKIWDSSVLWVSPLLGFGGSSFGSGFELWPLLDGVLSSIIFCARLAERGSESQKI